MSKNAWVTLATNDSYSLGALVVAHSLKRVHTVHQLAVLITPGVSEAMRTKLRNVFNLVEEVNLLDSKDEANLALLKRPELGITFTKLHCWRLTQYEKCVFLDADTLVLRNSDELFEREELSAAPDIGWPDCFNSGVYVYRPSLETFASLLQFAVTNGSFDGGDQGLLNAYFSEWAHKDIQKHLPFVYNTSSVATYSYLPAFKQFGHNTKILHFIGVSKPWLQNFNSETRKVYVPSECYHLANFLQYWWDIFCEDVHSRLSPDMQQVFSRWIAPGYKQVSGSQYRSTVSGTLYGGTGNHHDHEPRSYPQQDQQQHEHHQQQQQQHQQEQQQQQQQQREQFIPSYDSVTVYVDPWEEFLQRQEREWEQRKQEEERLYFQYLNELRSQEHLAQTRQEHEQWLARQSQDHAQHHHHHHDHHHRDQPHHTHHALHHHDDHHHHHHYQHQQQESSEAHSQVQQQQHHDANVFQRTEQWVDRMIQQHHQQDQGHWETQPGASSDSAGNQSYQPSAGGGNETTWKGQDQPTSESNGAIARQSEQFPLRTNDQPEQGPVQPQEAPRQHSTGTDPRGHHDTGDGGGDGGGGSGGDSGGVRVDACGLAGALAQLHLGEAKSVEQEAYEEHMRRQCWETGNIDYMGRDSFDNIWRRIQQTLNAGSAGAASDAATTATTSTTSTVVTVAPARSTRSPRSRSSTPKRDARDRSPTPQPEDKVPVEKKEAHVVPPPAIAEEDDQSAIVAGLVDASGAHSSRQHQHHKIPPPIQYDPTTNTTTLTKRVFAGYQQFITTKSPEGRTRSHTKLVYDPSVEDEDQQQQQESERQKVATKGSDVVDSPPKPASLQQKSVESKEQQPQAPKPAAVPQQPTTAKTSSFSPTPLKPSVPAPPEPRPQPQQQQQLAQESLAGKASASTTIDSLQPIKTVRKKRTISPPSSSSASVAPQVATTIAATTQPTALTASATTVQHTDAKIPPDQSPHKPRTLPSAPNRSSSSSSNSQVTASSRSSAAGPPAATSSNRTVTNAGPALPKTAATGPSLRPSASSPPSAAPSSSPLTPSSPPTLPTRSVPPLLERRQQKQKESLAAAAAAAVAPSVATIPADEPVVPPVPPRRKRESRTARLGNI
ncbi:box A-binding factor isoform X2 [Anopheles aquasalis]|uniref:box A-binding factor isoform X2 n=1 Tax=Anopheles aquasalis TaxID=42839 RepID=UPI00215A1892|nr:box A-binding factor isoform X2 [Anopheles aquasalis]